MYSGNNIWLILVMIVFSILISLFFFFLTNLYLQFSPCSRMPSFSTKVPASGWDKPYKLAWVLKMIIYHFQCKSFSKRFKNDCCNCLINSISWCWVCVSPLLGVLYSDYPAQRLTRFQWFNCKLNSIVTLVKEIKNQ